MPGVRPGSAFEQEQGLLFRVTQLKWHDERTVVVHGGYYEAPLSSAGHTYRLEFQEGEWKVTKDTLDWIS